MEKWFNIIWLFQKLLMFNHQNGTMIPSGDTHPSVIFSRVNPPIKLLSNSKQLQVDSGAISLKPASMRAMIWG